MTLERKMYWGGHIADWDNDVDAMTARARSVLERDGCSPETIKHSYIRTERYEINGPFYVWEGSVCAG